MFTAHAVIRTRGLSISQFYSASLPSCGNAWAFPKRDALCFPFHWHLHFTPHRTHIPMPVTISPAATQSENSATRSSCSPLARRPVSGPNGVEEGGGERRRHIVLIYHAHRFFSH